MKPTIYHLADMSNRLCEKEGWDRGWSNGGCYLHLEVSEFIEALRGKGDPVEEAGDVLFVLLSMLKYANIDLDKVIAKEVLKVEWRNRPDWNKIKEKELKNDA